MKNNLRNFRFIYIRNLATSIAIYKSITVWFIIEKQKNAFFKHSGYENDLRFIIFSNTNLNLKRKLLDQYYLCRTLFKMYFCFIYEIFSENV